MESIQGVLIYPAGQTQRPGQVRTAIQNWAAKHATLDSAPDVVEVPAGKYSPTNPAMLILLWFGSDPVADRAEADSAWAAISGLSLTWVQPGSWAHQIHDDANGVTVVQSRAW